MGAPADKYMAFVIAIVGAQSTGKTTLAHRLGEALLADDRRVAVVPEYLREFGSRLQRTPVLEEQPHVAFEQTRRIAAAAAMHEIVVSDTTALMVAIYSELIFGDTSLYAEALAAHQSADLTLLTALDLAWQAEGHQRAGEHLREPVDALVRCTLGRAGCAYSVVAGQGDERVAAALKAVRHAMQQPADEAPQERTRWKWMCERCGDVDCERHLLARG